MAHSRKMSEKLIPETVVVTASAVRRTLFIVAAAFTGGIVAFLLLGLTMVFSQSRDSVFDIWGSRIFIMSGMVASAIFGWWLSSLCVVVSPQFVDFRRGNRLLHKYHRDEFEADPFPIVFVAWYGEFISGWRLHFANRKERTMASHWLPGFGKPSARTLVQALGYYPSRLEELLAEKGLEVEPCSFHPVRVKTVAAGLRFQRRMNAVVGLLMIGLIVYCQIGRPQWAGWTPTVVVLAIIILGFSTSRFLIAQYRISRIPSSIEITPSQLTVGSDRFDLTEISLVRLPCPFYPGNKHWMTVTAGRGTTRYFLVSWPKAFEHSEAVNVAIMRAMSTHAGVVQFDPPP